MWNDRLAALTDEYPTAILSIVDPNGYPLSVRCTVRMDASRQVAIITLLILLHWRQRGAAKHVSSFTSSTSIWKICDKWSSWAN
jgi:hypothetical protein